MKVLRSFLLMLCYLACMSTADVSAWEQRDLLQKKASPEQVLTSLLPTAQWVAYPAYTDRKAWDTLLRSVKTDLIKEGEQFLGYEWKVVRASDYLEYERSGSRTVMEGPFNANNLALARLVLAELAEGQGRFLPQLINGVWQACDMPSWVASAHLPLQRTKRSLPDPSEQIIDLVSSDMGSFFAWVHYFFKAAFDQTDPVIARRLRTQLQDRILDPYMQRSDYWWQAFSATPETLVNNWNPWCNFNVLTCFLLLEEDPEKRARGVYRTMVSVDKFINYVHADGACEEGPSYWGHAAGKLYDYLQLLHDATAGRISLFQEPMVRQMGEYISRSYVGNGWVVNFADASAKGGGDAGLVHRYGTAVGSREMQQFAGYLHAKKQGDQEHFAGRDLYRTLENIRGLPALHNTPAARPQAATTWYPQTQFCYLRNARGFFLAAKGGHNNESHNHNDVGTFSLYLDAIPFIVDAGVGTYTRQTFGKERYTIWTMQSNYHNLPLINGTPQKFGRSYQASAVRFDEKNRTFSLDISGAYPAEAGVRAWQRSLRLTEKKGLILTETYTLEKITEPLQLNFITWAEPVLAAPGQVRLVKEGKAVLLRFDNAQFETLVEPIPQSDIRLSRVWGERLYRLTLKGRNTTTTGKHNITFDPIDP